MNGSAQFPVFSRVLHWLMAAMVLAMLFIGAGMVTSLERYHLLVSIHRPLGIAILALAVIRLVNRQVSRVPKLPEGVALWQRLAAKGSHVVLYALMIYFRWWAGRCYPPGSTRSYCTGQWCCRRSRRMTRCCMRRCGRCIRIWRICCS